MGTTSRPVVPVLGALAVIISSFGILGALAIAPWFSLFDHALSDLGRSGRPSAFVFNGALITSGILGIGFIRGLWQRSDHAVKRIGLGLFGMAAAFVVLIGIFPSPNPYHYPVSVGYYFTLTFALFVYGTADALRGHVGIGLVMIWFGILHTLSWIVWWGLFDGQAITGPEMVGVVVFSAWVSLMVWRTYSQSAE